MGNWWTWLTGGTVERGKPARTRQDIPPAPPRAIDNLAAHPSPRNAVAIADRQASGDRPDDDPLAGVHELAEVKPLGTVGPRNKHELVEELRKNYTEVIELVRRTNTHLDDQARRQAAQEQRQTQLLDLTRDVAQSLSAIQQHSSLLLEALAKLSLGQDQAVGLQSEIRDSLLAGRRDTVEATDRIHGTLESLRELAGQSHATQQDSLSAIHAVQAATESARDAQTAIEHTMRAVGTSVSSVNTSADQLLAISRAAHDRAQRLDRSSSRYKWMAIAGLILAALGVVGLLLIAILLRG